jgi:fumarate reductase flavoprotein subunit
VIEAAYDKARAITWEDWGMTDYWDVIVVGAGSAGLPAAIFAAQRGARVLQIEADSRIGGTLHLSSGQISAAGTSQQKALGIDDSPADHYEDAQRIVHGTIDPTLGRLAIDHAAETLEWLLACGFEPEEGTPKHTMGHEPFRTRRYLWGTNKAISILDVIAPVHAKLVAEGRIDLRLDTKLTGLVQDDAGAVTGVTSQSTAGAQTHNAHNVVLASGGYAANPEMWAELTPGFALRSYCNAFSRGDGIRAARDLGAFVDGGDKYMCTFAGVLEDPGDPLSTALGLNLAPHNRMPWEIYVNTSGKRFVREDHPSVDHRENALLVQDDTKMFIVFDEAIRQNAPPIDLVQGAALNVKFGNHPHYSKAGTIAGLAQQMGLNADTLADTIARYNAAVDSGVDEDFGRETMLRRIERAPFYAIHAGGITVLSPAGLNADERLRVVKKDGTPIPNLYCAGEILGFGRTSGKGFVGGMSLMPALTFGRLLGDSILQWEGARAAAQ